MNMEASPYLAGIIDGCGYIHIRKYVAKVGKARAGEPIYTLALSISHKDKRLMDWLVEELGYGYVRKDGSTYRWVITGRTVGELLTEVRPYMVVKEEQADIAVKYAASIHTDPGVLPLSEFVRAERAQGHKDLIALHGGKTTA